MRHTLLLAGFMALLFASILENSYAQDLSAGSTQCRIGHFTVTIPQGWNAFSSSDKTAAKTEFSNDLAPGLKQYEKAGGITPHMEEFEIYQQPSGGQLIGWTLVIPEQADFLNEILKRENDQFEQGKSMSGGSIKGGSCRLVKVGAFDVVRVDVVMANGNQTTNLHFWSPKTPGIISTLMIGLRPTESAEIQNDTERIIATVIVSEELEQGTSDAILPETTREYKSVSIGSQEWMAENLNVDRFRNGDAIPEIRTAEEWLAAYQSESPAWCYYNNDPKNGEKYGRLYNWYAVADPRGLAPAGWHIPTDSEWQMLMNSCGGMGAAFEKLKAADGFAAQPCGARYYKDASFNHMGNITFWWSASKNDKWNAWYHAMHFGYNQVARDNGGMNTGHSVRCVKDKGADSVTAPAAEAPASAMPAVSPAPAPAPPAAAAPAPEKTTPAPTPQQTQDEAVVIVKGQSIKESEIAEELNKRLNVMKQQMGGQDVPEEAKEALRSRIIDMIVKQRLLEQRLKEKGLTVTDEEVTAEIQKIAAQQNLTMEQIEQQVQMAGMTMDDVKDQLRYKVMMEKLVEVETKDAVTAEDVRHYYDENSQIFDRPEQVQASHILVKVEPEATADAKAEAKKKAEDILGKVKAGEDFAALAREYSDCPSSAQGGDLGSFGRGLMVKAFEDAAFAMKPGEVSGIVETQFGYHIIKITDKTAAGKTPFDEVKDQLEQRLRQEKQQEFVQAYGGSMRADEKIEHSPEERDVVKGQDIVNLLREKKIEIETSGSGIQTVNVRIRKLVPDPVTVRIPVGSYFVSSRQSAQNMVTTAESRVRITDDNWRNVSVSAACANRPRDIPGSDDTFTVQQSPHQEELVRLMPVLDKAGVSYAVRQAAVWIVTDNASYSDLGILVSRPAYAAFGGTRMITEPETARAMQICDEAGIDVTRKRIWNDRQIVVNGLPDGDIKLWLQAKQ